MDALSCLLLYSHPNVMRRERERVRERERERESVCGLGRGGGGEAYVDNTQ